MDDDEAIAQIREDFAILNFDYDDHSLSHMAEGRFDIYDVGHAVAHGDLIEEAPARGRLLFCGRVPGLREDNRYHNGWLHVSVQYENGTRAAMVTSYRPNLIEWRSERVRR